MNATITVIPGDGIGQEVTAEAIRVLDTIQEKYGHRFDYEYGLLGGCAIDQTGTALPQETLDLCRKSDAILFGAAGGPGSGKMSQAQNVPNARLEQFAKNSIFL